MSSLLIGAALIFKGEQDSVGESKWGDEPEATELTGDVEDSLEDSSDEPQSND